LEDDNKQLKTRIDLILGERERLYAEVTEAKLKMHDVTKEAEHLSAKVKQQRYRDQNLDL